MLSTALFQVSYECVADLFIELKIARSDLRQVPAGTKDFLFVSRLFFLSLFTYKRLQSLVFHCFSGLDGARGNLEMVVNVSHQLILESRVLKILVNLEKCS